MAVIDKRNSTWRLLLGRKHAETLFRFPGGFSDINSPSFEEDAQRELMEETNLDVQDIKYIGSLLVDDWRYRSQIDKIKTLFYFIIPTTYKAIAGDDLQEVKWFDIEEINPEKDLVPNHRKLYSKLRVFLMENLESKKKQLMVS